MFFCLSNKRLHEKGLFFYPCGYFKKALRIFMSGVFISGYRGGASFLMMPWPVPMITQKAFPGKLIVSAPPRFWWAWLAVNNSWRKALPARPLPNSTRLDQKWTF